jgi:GAF domain-containing protein
MQAPTADDEDARLEAVERYDLEDPACQEHLDVAARLASHVTRATVGLVTVIGEDQLETKASRNFEATAIDRAASMCTHLLSEPGELLVVPDAREDDRFADPPGVMGELGLRFYAGAPLQTAEGHVIGSLCALDDEPKQLDDEQRELLAALADQVMRNLVASHRLRELDEEISSL